MASINKIDSLGLGEYILQLAGEGKGSREISTILDTVKGVKISHASVNSWLKSVRQERAETTKAVVQETIKATVPRDLQILDEQIMQLDGWRKDETLKISDRLQIIREQRATISVKLDKSGANENDISDFATALQAARERAKNV